VNRIRASALVLAAALIVPAAPRAQAPQAAVTFDAAWKIVNDTHFDRSMNGVNWNAVRDELRPRAVAARNAGELREVLHDMLARLGQSHFAVIPFTPDSPSASRGDMGGDPGFDVRLVGRDLLVTRVQPDGAAAAAGVRPGWKLTAIESRPVAELLMALPAAANERLQNVEAWRIATTRLRGPSGSKVDASFDDGGGRTVPLTLERRPETGQPVTVGNLPTMFVRVESERRTTPGGSTAGIIRFNVWMAAVDARFQAAMDEFRTADGIVIDLRGNVGGLAAMLMGISGHFVSEPKSLGVMKTRDTELRFMANPRLVNAKGERVSTFGGPVAILVDAMTGSASECFAGGMQSIGRVRVFGQTSMGQALPALFDRLPNGDVLIHAYGDFVTANGTRLEGRGVVPDVAVPLRREELLAGRDAPLEAALQWIETSRGVSQPQRP
jgi:carboxyl-terminal processing protease